MTGNSIRERIVVNAQTNDSSLESIHLRIIPWMRTVGDRLNELMQAHPVYGGARGQSALSRASGVPQPTISRILKSSSTPETTTASKLAGVFGVHVEWLISERGPKQVDARGANVMSSGKLTVVGDPSTVIDRIVRAASELQSLGVHPDKLVAVARILETLRDAQKAVMGANQKIKKIVADAELPSDHEVLAAIEGLGVGQGQGAVTHERANTRGRRRKSS